MSFKAASSEGPSGTTFTSLSTTLTIISMRENACRSCGVQPSIVSHAGTRQNAQTEHARGRRGGVGGRTAVSRAPREAEHTCATVQVRMLVMSHDTSTTAACVWRSTAFITAPCVLTATTCQDHPTRRQSVDDSEAPIAGACPAIHSP